MASLCRDCLAVVPDRTPRRVGCGSPRVEGYGELAQMPMDCDAFYATVEKRDDPRTPDRKGDFHRLLKVSFALVALANPRHSAHR
jgi:hypothetical protein